MTRVTIVSLIYRSPEYAREFYKALHWATPEIEEGTADFYFVANNATPQTLRALKKAKIPHYEIVLPVLTDEEHSRQGFASPEYLGRVYAAYNFAVSKSKTDLVLLLNSDMVMSRGWLPRLLSVYSDTVALSPTLVERRHPSFGVYPGAIEANFGSNFRNFQRVEWDRFSDSNDPARVVVKPELPYMPTLVRKKWFKELGGYPHGNIQGSGGYSSVSSFGDEYFFNKLKDYGVEHKSVEGVYCYHFKEGERESDKLNYLKNILIPTLTSAAGKAFRTIWPKR